MARIVGVLGRILVLACICLALGQHQALAASGKTELTWYGQAAFKLVTPAGHVILLDPWFENSQNKDGRKTGDDLTKVDLILISHGHFDHVGQAAEISKRTGAKLVATLDLGEALVKYAGYPADNAGFDSLGNYGGVISFFDGEVKIAIVPAVHSSHVNSKMVGYGDDADFHWGGSPSGFVVMVRGGPTLYHTGDTDLFSDMALVSKYAHIDYMLACIGDHFTMGPARAAEAVALVQPSHVVPMHYGTFLPLMTGTPADFKKELKARDLDALDMPMIPGKTIVLK